MLQEHRLTIGSINLNRPIVCVASWEASYGSGSYGVVTRGTTGSKTWSGADSPKVARPKDAPPVYREFWAASQLRGQYGFKKRCKLYTFKPARVDRPENPYVLSLNRSFLPPGSFTRTQVWETGPLAGQVKEWLRYTNTVMPGDLSFPVPTWTSNDDLLLINKLRGAIVGSDFNIGVFLAEAHQSAELISSVAYRLTAFTRNLRKGNLPRAWDALVSVPKPFKRHAELPREWQSLRKVPFQGTSSHPKDTGILRPPNWGKRREPPNREQFGQLVLEAQYGWRPLLGDLTSGAESLAHQLNFPFKKRYVVRRSLTISPEAKSQWMKNQQEKWTVLDGRGSKNLVAIISEEPDWLALTGITNLASVVWEKTPWSFVADWAIPIGQWLEARNTVKALKAKYVLSTIVRKELAGYVGAETSGLLDVSGNKYRLITAGNDGQARLTSVSMTREILTTLPVPKPQFRGVEKTGSLQHCINALALLATTLRW